MHSQTNIFSREISHHFDSYFEDYEITTSYVEVLLFLQDHAPVLQKQIADHLKMDPSTITRFIKKLDRGGWVKKEKKSGRVHIVLAPEKREMVEDLRLKFSEAENDLEKVLGEKFTETTRRLLDHGNKRFEDNTGS